MSRGNRAPGRSKVPESGVLRACLDVLGYAHIWHERRNTVPVLVDDGRGGKRPIKVAEKGTPDIFCTPILKVSGPAGKYKSAGITKEYQFDKLFHYAHPLWIECKSDSGKQSPEQIEFQRRAEAVGHTYLLVRDVDTLRDWLKEHGA